ncbi:hypothetical protein [Bradyrhizobium sp. JYMT SZCCT0180]|uniref:hypothetical protein n=1 Tax=Bradyrhizobium sp. JYMT SZCCT0180 TaxID=2807666 RepID=UPI001BA475CD|nr:hypothetical protein [Bradyrhizobium sp. JYMT SZCCT0180]MBR1212315.1 hypothetical protein [Bradyrhizobium sp. JYMT SZCCT0180]
MRDLIKFNGRTLSDRRAVEMDIAAAVHARDLMNARACGAIVAGHSAAGRRGALRHCVGQLDPGFVQLDRIMDHESSEKGEALQRR